MCLGCYLNPKLFLSSLSSRVSVKASNSKKIETTEIKRYVANVFFVLCDSRCMRYTFVAGRERERIWRRRRSLSFSRTRACVMRIIFHFAFPSAKNEKFGREKDTNADVVLNRFSDENDGFC